MREHENNTPSLGVALIIRQNSTILLGRRLKQPMPDSWQLPGGWVHYAESPQQAVVRKLSEFPHMSCSGARFTTYTDNHFAGGLHSVSLYFQMDCLNPEGVDLQRNQHCHDWCWADWYDLPQPLFLPLHLLQQSGYKPFI